MHFFWQTCHLIKWFYIILTSYYCLDEVTYHEKGPGRNLVLLAKLLDLEKPIITGNMKRYLQGEGMATHIIDRALDEPLLCIIVKEFHLIFRIVFFCLELIFSSRTEVLSLLIKFITRSEKSLSDLEPEEGQPTGTSDVIIRHQLLRFQLALLFFGCVVVVSEDAYHRVREAPSAVRGEREETKEEREVKVKEGGRRKKEEQ